MTNEPQAAALDDPVAAQIVRNRLIAVTDQMRLALQSVSGSPTVTEASDFFTGLYLPDGEFATMGYQVTFEAPPVGALIRHLLQSGRRLKDGDRILGNDPFIGALHQNDLQMCAPLFFGDELVGWAGVMAHQTDMGGMDFASWSPKAREIWQEGLRIPAVTLVDGGELREDVLDMILAATRLPAQVGLDVRAFLATLNVAADRVGGLCQRFGVATVRAVMRQMIADSEAALRERLALLPDGVIHVRDFLEHDGHEDRLYCIDLVATKRADVLELDFSGSSEQAPGFVNCSRAGLAGGVAGAVIPTLGHDIAWNEGLLRPIQITAPDGLVCTAIPPAPVGSATVETVWVVSNAVAAALNRLLACSPATAQRAQAVSSGTMATFNLGGTNQYGERFGLHLMDPLAGGFGAFADHDGPDAAGPINTPSPAIADVESNELVAPLVYLHRKLIPDTGGAGRYRGGRAAGAALTLSVPAAEALIMTHGLEVPNSTGISGGLPGGSIRQRWGSGVLAGGRPPVGASLAGLTFDELGPKPGSMRMTDEDVFDVVWQGGGGSGDPLDRDPSAVAADVADGAVSAGAAFSLYGVVLAQGATMASADLTATAERRRFLRTVRLSGTAGSPAAPRDPAPVDPGAAGPSAPPPAPAPGETWLPLGERLRAIRGTAGWRVETTGGAVLSRGNTRWRQGAILRPVVLPPESGERLHPGLAVTAAYCPVTGAQLAVDVHLAGQSPLDDVDLDLSPGGLAESLAATPPA